MIEENVCDAIIIINAKHDDAAFAEQGRVAAAADDKNHSRRFLTSLRAPEYNFDFFFIVNFSRMPAPPIDGSAPRSELQELQLKSQQVTDEVGLQNCQLLMNLFIVYFTHINIKGYLKLIT